MGQVLENSTGTVKISKKSGSVVKIRSRTLTLYRLERVNCYDPGTASLTPEPRRTVSITESGVF